MNNEQKQQSETMNGSALGNISVLSPSQRREQERQRREQTAKEAAEKEKRRIAAAKRKAAEEAAEASARRKEMLSRIPIAIARSIFLFVLVCILSAIVLFIVAIAISDSSDPDMGIVWYSLYFGGFAALWSFVKDMQN